MGWEEKLREKIYEASLVATGLTPAEIKEMFKTRSKEKLSTFSTNFSPFLLKLFVAFLLVFQAFYPKIVENIFWGLLIVTIVLVVIIIVITIFAAGLATIGLRQVIEAVVLLFIIVLLIRIYPSPDYSRWISAKLGPIVSGACFLITLAIVSILILPRGTVGFLVGTLASWILLNIVGPFLLNTLPGFGFCVPQSSSRISLPFLPKCEERLTKETMIFQGRAVKIPVSGGVHVEFGFNGKPRPLPAGQTYQEVFTLRNYYEGNIKVIDFVPWIHSKYMGGIDFINQRYRLKKDEFKPKEMYQDVIVFDPKEMEEKASISCPWNSEIIKANMGYTGIEKIDCAIDKPCSKGVCAAVSNYVCTCVDWINATCSGMAIYSVVNITHTGFFRGNVSLYYYENPTSETITFPELIQGPIKMRLNFIPNPYIRKYYDEFVDTIQLFADLQFSGHELKINNIEVEPILTTVTTRDYQNELEFNETIGIKKKNCNGISELEQAVNSGRKMWSGVLCDFGKPEVTLKITNMKTGETISLNDVNLDQIGEYCNGRLESTKDVYNLIKNVGLCTVLNNTAVKRALEFTQVVIEMEYTITETFYSPTITPYWTPVCG